MALPQISTPKFEVKIPSTGKIIQYRSYLVREEKILMMAMESGDNKQILIAIKEVIKACTFNKIKVDDLALFDLEYIFLKLRAKSVGEAAKIGIKCDHCEHTETVSINLDSIEVFFPEKADKNHIIKLTDDVGVTLKYLSVDSVNGSGGSTADDMISIIAAGIENIFDAETVYPASQSTKEELVQFIESLNRSQLEKIEAFFKTTPRLEKKIKFTCTQCSKDTEVTLSGLNSFFA